MIKQTAIGLDSRSQAEPRQNGMLPLFTAPMTTVVDDKTYETYKKLGIHPIIPRTSKVPDTYDGWIALSLDEFIDIFNISDEEFVEHMSLIKPKVLIDVANGNMPRLHTAIKKAKELYGKSIQIMAGNVSSENAFMELALTGVDYIRVGIGGGGACMTTVHTGVGQDCLEELVNRCKERLRRHNTGKRYLLKTNPYLGEEMKKYEKAVHNQMLNTKIVADGISSYIKQNNFHRNGYAAINNLLFAGADYVMIGSIFAAAYGSASQKYWVLKEQKIPTNRFDPKDQIVALYRGMSTREEQKNYNPDKPDYKASEGKTMYLDCEVTLHEWMWGAKDDRHDEFPGFYNALVSAMAYTGAKTLDSWK